MIQNLPRETGWHLRGTRRIGVSYDDVETIQQCVCIPSNIVKGDYTDDVILDRKSGSFLRLATYESAPSEGH